MKQGTNLMWSYVSFDRVEFIYFLKIQLNSLNHKFDSSICYSSSPIFYISPTKNV